MPDPRQTADDPRHRWDLTDLYPADSAWRTDLARMRSDLPALAEAEAALAAGIDGLAPALDRVYGLRRRLQRIVSYATLRSDEDLRDSRGLEMRGEAKAVATAFSEGASFLEPGILALGRESVEAELSRRPELEPYRHVLDDVLRRAPHTLDAAGERLVAAAGTMADAPLTVYGVLANGELPWPELEVSSPGADGGDGEGESVTLDHAGYSRMRTSSDREIRRRAFREFWGLWRRYKQTFGAALYANLKRDLFYARARGYGSCLESALDDDAVPTSVYTTLVDECESALPTLHRYLGLRRRLLGLDELRYWDSYPSIAEGRRRFGIDEAKRLVSEAVAPLGDAYVATTGAAFAERWVDWSPRRGKRSGAYSAGSVVDVHPYVLMNFTDDWESVSTLAHEWGHAMHSHLANAAQPYPTAGYSIFVAEVASTLNEALLLDRALADATDDDHRLFVLGSALDGLRGTFFRQTMFAAFELEIHEMVERGEAPSGDRFSEAYGRLLRRWHGHDAGVMSIDEEFFVEWAYVPHFYYDFYVYQYATSVAAASQIAEEILAGDTGARDRYLAVLAAGGSRYPYELLADAGVDLATAEPYRALATRMERLMDEVEAIIDRRPGGSVRGG